MAFIQEFLRHYIAQNMQDPAERNQYWTEHTQRMARNAAKKKESWKQPTKPFGFWNSDVSNAKFMLNREPGHMNLPGRGSPHGGETQSREA